MAGVAVVALALVVAAGLLVGTEIRSERADVAWVHDTTDLEPSAQQASTASGEIVVFADSTGLRGLDPTTGDGQWSIEAGLRSVEVVGDRIYAQCCTDDDDAEPTRLLAVDAATGKVLWEVERSNADRSIPIVFAPVAADSGAVYVSTNDDEVFSVDAKSGGQNWSANAEVFGEPAVGDGVIAVGGAGTAVGLDAASGRAKWTVAADPLVEFEAPAAVSGRFVFTSSVGDSTSDESERTVPAVVLAADADTGEEVWRHESDARALTAPVVTGDLVVTGVSDSLSGTDSGLLAFGIADGSRAWTLPDLVEVSTPVVDDDRVYVGESNGNLVGCADAETGDLVWTYAFDESGGASIAAKGASVWAVGTSADVVALDAGEGSVTKQFDAPSSVVSLSTGEGLVFVGTWGDGLFALDAES